LTDFSKRRIHSAKILEGASPDVPKKFSVMLEGTSPDVPKIFGSAGALPSRKTTRYSPLATRCSPFAIRQSLFAVHYSLFAIRYSLPFRLGRSLALPIHSVPRPSSHAPF
jgi:hypothetical protein